MSHDVHGQEALDSLYWQAEILQALYWMRGEGLATEVETTRLAEFLAVDAAIIRQQLERLALEGFVEALGIGDDAPPETGTSYRLTPSGITEGGRSFHDEFADFIRPAHGECGSGCWCKDPKHAGEPCPNEPAPEDQVLRRA